jgi:hypothetical protein
MNVQTKTRPTVAHRSLLAILSLVMMFAFAPFAYGAQAAPNYPYTVSTYHGTSPSADLDQHVVVKIDYGAPVVLTASPDHVADPLAIYIAGRDIKSSTYLRPVTASVSGDDDNILVLDIGNVVDESGNPAFTAQFNGILRLSGVPAVTVDGNIPRTEDITTVIPTGVSVTDFAIENGVQARVDTPANVRGMVHIGIYAQQTQGGPLTPLWDGSDTGDSGAKTYTIHAHNFSTMSTDDLARLIGGISSDSHLPLGVSITYSGNSLVTLTGPSGAAAYYVYIFDDDLLKAHGTDYETVVANGGVLPRALLLP